jgi:2-polyprenyl-3-methyl-5-hydroxy-6-metoxy-1,4-benzoquinol methylase
VLDLGCGIGAAGLAAAAKGATAVCADIRPEAVALVLKNAERNGLTIEARPVDWNDPPLDLGAFDGIIAADVLYDDGMLRGVLRFVRHHLAPGGLALIADPMRVLPGGVAGAARLHGLESDAAVLHPGSSVIGGVTLYRLWRRPGR